MTDADPVDPREPALPPQPEPEPETVYIERDVPPSVRAAQHYVEHAQTIRVPNPSTEIGAPEFGRNLDARERETESAALALLRDYFALNRQAMLDSDE